MCFNIIIFKDGKKYMKKIKIKYHNQNLIEIMRIPLGDWIDLRASENVVLKQGEFKVISLGVSMKLPKGYEAHIVPRSSSFKKWGILQTNGVGVVDNSYNGDNDIWGMPVFATRDTQILVNDRICQFRIVKTQKKVGFKKVQRLIGKDRGGFGSTGSK